MLVIGGRDLPQDIPTLLEWLRLKMFYREFNADYEYNYSLYKSSMMLNSLESIIYKLK